MKKIVIIDGHNLLFRMFYGIPASIKNELGQEIKGVIGFIGSIKKIIETFTPYSIIVIFDSETSKTNNLKWDKNYKANRKNYETVPEPENPFSQLPLIKKALNFLNIFYEEVIENEADDYIASIITQQKNYEFTIVSTDTDFFQLIDNRITLYIPRGKKSHLYTIEELYKKYSILPNQYVLFKSLTGDKSDNIKGINGIGIITAAKIASCNSIENFLLNKQNEKIKEKLMQNKETIEKNQKLIEMNRNLDTKKVTFHPLNKEKLNLKTLEIIKKSTTNAFKLKS